MLEKVYEACLCHELRKVGLSVQRQLEIPIVYDGLVFEEALRLDLLVEDLIICELKAVDQVKCSLASPSVESSETNWKEAWVSHQL